MGGPYDWDPRTSELSRELIFSVPLAQMTVFQLAAFKAALSKVLDLEEELKKKSLSKRSTCGDE